MFKKHKDKAKVFISYLRGSTFKISTRIHIIHIYTFSTTYNLLSTFAYPCTI